MYALCVLSAKDEYALFGHSFKLDNANNGRFFRRKMEFVRLSEKPFFTRRLCTSQNLSTTYYIKIEFVSICPHVENSQGVLTEEVICAVPENI